MFNESQERHLVTTLQHVDRMLGEAWDKLSQGDRESLFPMFTPDATPEQRKVLADYRAQLRFAMRRFVEANDLRERSNPISALRAFHTAIGFADIAVEELLPKYLRGYGTLDADTTASVQRFVAELTTLLRRVEDYLAKGEGGDLAGRLARMDGTPDEIALLREMERIIRQHGLVELRATLERLVERVAVPTFEVAVFGHVNAGKSSLLNWWLGRDVLPTGVIPVTAVPTRIVHGSTAQVRVKSLGSPAELVALERLPDFVTEQGNPRNVRGVLNIEIELPAERLASGICLVDTPGLGSLATAGAAQTLEYLPRCDLAILLIEAGGVIARDDLDVARAILDGGSDLAIVLSKADRLADAELSAALAYATDVFAKALGIALPIAPASTAESRTALVEQWFASEIAPRLARHRESAAVSIRRKIAALRESVMAVMQARLSGGSGEARQSLSRQDIQRIATARTRIEDLRRWMLGFAVLADSDGNSLTDTATNSLLDCWMRRDSDPAAISQQVLAAVTHQVTAAGDQLSGRLADLSTELERIQADLSGKTAEDRSESRGRPVFEPPSLAGLNCARPLLLPSIRAVLRPIAKQRIEQALRERAFAQISLFGSALREWGARRLDEIAERFETFVAPLEGSERSRDAGARQSGDASGLRHDLGILQKWGSTAA